MAIEGGLTGIDGLRGLEPGLGSGRPPGGWRVCAPRGVCKDFRGSRRGSGYVLEDLQGVGRVWGGLGCRPYQRRCLRERVAEWLAANGDGVSR